MLCLLCLLDGIIVLGEDKSINVQHTYRINPTIKIILIVLTTFLPPSIRLLRQRKEKIVS